TRRWTLAQGDHGSRSLDRSGRDLPDAELAQAVAYRVDRVAHLLRSDRSDAADPKSLHLRELPRIEDETLVAYAFIEALEHVFGLGRSMEGDDDRRLNPRIEKDLEPELLHAGDQRLVVRCVAGEPCRLTAVRAILLERGIDRHHDVCRRRVAPLGGLL